MQFHSSSVVHTITGLLDAVNLIVSVSEDFTIVLNWTAPFTLLGASEISYCVDVVNLTDGGALQSECMINMTQFTYAMPLIEFACGELSFTITPVNRVGNGTTSTVTSTDNINSSLVPPELVNSTKLSTGFLLVMVKYEKSTCISLYTYAMILQSAPVCDVELKFEDINNQEIIILGNTNVSIDVVNIIILSQRLGENREYIVTVTASNNAGNATSNTSISKPVLHWRILFQLRFCECLSIRFRHSS